MAAQILKPKKKPGRTGGGNRGAKNARISDIVINGTVHIPPWVTDHDSFRYWACSEAFPLRGHFFFLNGEFWVDLSMETLVHNQIKGVIGAVLTVLVLNESTGKYLGDRMMLANLTVGLSCEPDGMFVSDAALADGRARLEDGNESLEVTGAPDLVLEVISKTSVEKDTITLKNLYAKAGITEYWLVDATAEMPELAILRLVAGKYVTVRKDNGWVKSNVLKRLFRLTSKLGSNNLTQFNLETK
jgi:Uma2 family endonuclease